MPAPDDDWGGIDAALGLNEHDSVVPQQADLHPGTSHAVLLTAEQRAGIAANHQAALERKKGFMRTWGATESGK
eukprot:COSAG05_NODE_1070_length_5967_cov_444.629857_2_plen_74_part_00